MGKRKDLIAAETTNLENFQEEFRVLTLAQKVMKLRHRAARVLECWSSGV